ncbi:MAG: 5-(carboxyamino)imidazole ribonucleotide synthase [Alphaproteobacteria bacterium]|nr:5-(carboxyamino)imidazole ribonucleotide synthase [Alphaproteobacteria bacterium]
MSALPPGSTIGILGGGQLARMLVLAAASLGLKCKIFAPELDSPAFQVSDSHLVANYGDEAALLEFAAEVDAITYEFENVPVAAVTFLEKLKPVRPGSKALRVAQDRLNEKNLARDMGAMTAGFVGVNSQEELRKAVKNVGLPAILKTVRFGYDGKGQAKILNPDDVEPAWAALKGAPAILESFVNFDKEISVICARGVDGQFAAYEPVENVHRNHILYTSTVPAKIDDMMAIEAVYLAQRMAETLDYVGVMGVEFFVGGAGLYVNEIAPRVHNSGHWTQNACVISQFEQHMRAVAGWPLGVTTRHSDVVMTNLLGDEADNWQVLAAQPDVGLHLYGKAESRPGRKMGHFNRITPRQG